MAKYIIDIPDDGYVSKEDGQLYIPLKSAGCDDSINPTWPITGYHAEPYTEPCEQSVKNNNIHLCWSCQNSYPECHAKVKDVLFGDGVGNDNICCCNAYRPTESNEDEIRQKIEDEVWEFAKKLISMSGNEVSEMWGYATNFGEVMYNTTYSEAKAKHDAWRKQKGEIRVGDEVMSKISDRKGIVMNSDESDNLTIMYVDDGYNSKYFEKTGRSFPELGDVLKKMKENENEIHSLFTRR